LDDPRIRDVKTGHDTTQQRVPDRVTRSDRLERRDVHAHAKPFDCASRARATLSSGRGIQPSALDDITRRDSVRKRIAPSTRIDIRRFNGNVSFPF